MAHAGFHRIHHNSHVSPLADLRNEKSNRDDEKSSRFSITLLAGVAQVVIDREIQHLTDGQLSEQWMRKQVAV